MPKATDNQPDFSTKLQELEAITAWFESEEVDLNAALDKFERGMRLADELRRELGEVENRVEKIKARFDAPAAATGPAEIDADTGADTDDEPTLF